MVFLDHRIRDSKIAYSICSNDSLEQLLRALKGELEKVSFT
jgi:hypothetical protein